MSIVINLYLSSAKWALSEPLIQLQLKEEAWRMAVWQVARSNAGFRQEDRDRNMNIACPL